MLLYTSVATTLLLLLRSMTFDNVDEVYTYLSPDIDYFPGRHLPYVLTAGLCKLVIVVGLPLLLLLEPLLNHKINLTKIKTATWSISRMLQRQVLQLCSLLHVVSSNDFPQHYCYFTQQSHLWILIDHFEFLVSLLFLFFIHDYWAASIADKFRKKLCVYIIVIWNISCKWALIHVTLWPNRSNILNVFDGFMLQLMVVVQSYQLLTAMIVIYY